MREPRRNEGCFEISRLGARYGLSRITSRNAGFATNTGLARHGPTSSPNGRGAGSMEKLFVRYEALAISKFDKHNGI